MDGSASADYAKQSQSRLLKQVVWTAHPTTTTDRAKQSQIGGGASSLVGSSAGGYNRGLVDSQNKGICG